MKIKLTIVLLVFTMALAACGSSSSQATPTLPPLETATAGPAGATATATLPSTTIEPTSTSSTGVMGTSTPASLPGTAQPTVTSSTSALPTATSSTGALPTETPAPLPGTVQPTAAAPTPLPTGTAGPLPSGDLSNNQMATILGGSLADYPWRMDFQSANQSAGQAITGTIEANSNSRMEVTIEEPLNGSPVTVDIIVIKPTLYAKVTGVPTSVLQVEGLQEGQWGQITASQDVLGLLNIAGAAANPTDLVMGLGFQDLLTPSTGNEAPFTLTATQQVSGVETNVYERQTTGSVGTTTYRVYVGTSDSRIYKMEAEGPINTTVTMTYDTSINIQPPIP